eukprot:scaffold48111_cov72-Phaeocystis_antarctica.AAC.2
MRASSHCGVSRLASMLLRSSLFTWSRKAKRQTPTSGLLSVAAATVRAGTGSASQSASLASARCHARRVAGLSTIMATPHRSAWKPATSCATLVTAGSFISRRCSTCTTPLASSACTSRCSEPVALQPAGESPPRPWPSTFGHTCSQLPPSTSAAGAEVEGNSAARAGSSSASPSGRSAAMKLITAKRFSTFCCSTAL